MGEEVKLFGVWVSPFSKRVEIALKLKGIEYQYIEEDLNNKSPLLLQYNPVHKKVPVLVHNGKPIAESLVIIEYIDETWKHNPILPHDPYDRAMARFWAKVVEDKVMEVMWKACGSQGTEREVLLDEAKEQMKRLEDEVKDKKFFGGEEIGLVDISGIFVGYWWGFCEEVLGVKLLTEENFPGLWRWKEELVKHSAVKECLPDKERLSALMSRLFGAAAE